jgi:steroid delta-isomerase-like uncharacterized protein
MAQTEESAIGIVRDVWGKAFNKRDGNAFLQHHSETVVLYDPTLPKPLRGRVELSGWFDGLFEMFPDCKMEMKRVYGLGDWVCAECVESGTMKGPIKHAGGEVPATGRSYEIGTILVCRVDSGKITEVRVFYDALELMAQLGLKP